MIYILTGMAKSGKTIVAKALAEKTGFSILSTDYLMMMFHRTNQDIGINADQSDPSVSKALEPYLESLIDTMIENKADHIIEGVHFLPSFAHRLMNKYPHLINIIFFGYKDWTPKQKKDDLITYKDHTSNCWYKHYDDKALDKLSEYLIKESNKQYKALMEYHLSYIEVNHIIGQIPDIIAYLLNHKPISS